MEQGEVVVVQGANGAGKSTLLQTCAGLRRVTSGTAEVLGYDLTVNADTRSAVRSRVGLLGHHTALYHDLTAAENLRLWARAVQAGESEVAYAFDSLNITRRLQDTTVAQLSAGQRRRVALAAIILRRPEIWLLDEPFSGLDGNSCELLRDVISKVAEAGATMLIASHETSFIDGCYTRTVTMAAGTVGSSGSIKIGSGGVI